MLGCYAALAPSAALASFATPVFPLDEICVYDPDLSPQARTVDPLLLIRHLIAAGPVSDAALDADADGDTLLVEKQLAFAQPGYCEAASGRHCSPRDESALRRLHGRLADFVRSEGGAHFRFERLQEPGPLDRAAVPALDQALEFEGQAFQIGEVLQVPPRYVRIVCREPAMAPNVAARPAAGPQPAGWQFDPDDEQGFRLTGSIDDLSKNRQRLTEVQPAQFSINADLRADLTTYLIDLVAGYDLEFAKGHQYDTSIIPFVLLNRLFDKSGDEVDRLGTGLQAALETHDSALGYSELALTPVYLTDTAFETRIGTLRFRWTPSLAQDAALPLGFYGTYDELLVQLNLDILGNVGHVFDPGENPDLQNHDEFFRLGGRLGLKIRGADDTLLEQIELDVSNRYLYNFNGTPEHLNYFQATLSYLFPGVDNYKVSFSYTSGRTEDTLTEVQYWSTQLGIRF